MVLVLIPPCRKQLRLKPFCLNCHQLAEKYRTL